MSKFIEIEYWATHQSGFKDDIVKEMLWINVDHVTSYFEPSNTLWFQDESKMSLTEEGKKTILNYFKAEQ